jgi:hypothetical protein
MVASLWDSLAACLFWTTLTAARLEGDPAGALAQAREHLTQAVMADVHAAEVAIAVDSLGAAWLRALTGFPADPEPQARLILGRAQAAIAARWPAARAAAEALPRPERPADPGIIRGLLDGAMRRFVDAAREALRPDGAPAPAPAAPASRPAEAVLAELLAIQRDLQAARNDMSRLLIRSVFWTMIAGIGAAMGLTAFAACAVTVARAPSRRLPDTRIGLAPRQPAVLRPPSTRRDTAFARALAAAGVPAPGSLRGHDREPGGLKRHTLDVVRAMARAVDTVGVPLDGGRSRPATPSERQAALTLAAAHDLGKVIVYQRDEGYDWTANAAVPHDSLGAQLLAELPALLAAFSPAELEALLVAAAVAHSPALLPLNASPLARALAGWLKRADAEAAALAADGGPADAAAADLNGETAETAQIHTAPGGGSS